jgi:hypothetical protein
MGIENVVAYLDLLQVRAAFAALDTMVDQDVPSR